MLERKEALNRKSTFSLARYLLPRGTGAVSGASFRPTAPVLVDFQAAGVSYFPYGVSSNTKIHVFAFRQGQNRDNITSGQGYL